VDPSVAPVARDGEVVAAGALAEPGQARWPYHALESPPPRHRDTELVLRPYHSWAERGPASMRIWLPTV
jgi:DUF1680 family protein